MQPKYGHVTHEIPVAANSVTNTPPPAAAKGAPYDLGSGTSMAQPEFEFAWESQSVVLMIVLVCTGLTIVQPGLGVQGYVRLGCHVDGLERVDLAA